MAGRRKQGATSDRRVPQQGQFLPHCKMLLAVTDTVIASPVASRIEKRSPTKPLRRSARLQALFHLENIPPITVKLPSAHKRRSFRLQTQYFTECPAEPEPPPAITCVSPLKGKKRAREDRTLGPTKRPRTVSTQLIRENKPEEEVNANPIDYWRKSGCHWPRQYFEQDSQAGEDFFKHDSWLDEQMEQSPIPVVQYVEINGIRYPRPVKKVPTSLRRRQSDSSLSGSADQKQRESKIAPYRNTRYPTLLEAKGSYMREFDVDDIPERVKDLCRTLLERPQAVPQDSLFRDDLFAKVCQKIQERNEAMIIQDITRLIVPSAQNLAIRGATHLKHLVESVNEGWIGSIPVEGPRPQPDYCVGLRRSAFTDEQLQRLDPLIGSVYDTSFFVASYRMYFPFLTCEVKCGAAALDVADRQNAHSMTLAIRGIVELFRLVKREKELHQEILAFSVSHDHRGVRMYGHYPIVDGEKVTFYRHPIHEFSFTALDGKDKWTAYRFTKNVYDVWMPTHLKRLCSLIDQLPSDLNFEVSQESELRFSEASGLSQEMGGLLSGQSYSESASQLSREDSELVPIVPQTITPETSVSQEKGQSKLKKPKRKHTAKS